MHTVHVSRDINQPHRLVWSALDDFGGIHKFHPLVESSPIVNGIGSGEGAERVCHFKGGGTLHERVVDYTPERKMTVTVLEAGKFPLKAARAELEAVPTDQGVTRTSMTMHFQPKFGPMGWLMAKVLMKKRFERVLTGMLKGLEEHVARQAELSGPLAVDD